MHLVGSTVARPSNTTVVARKVLRQIRARGLMLHHGREFPSITSLVCGEPISGSWWSHPKADLIYWVMDEIEDSAEVTEAKLINGKVTAVHRTWWSALQAIGTARQAWQTRGLTPLARSMLRKADKGSFRVDQHRTRAVGKPTDAARMLQRRLLVHATELHTETGKHTKVLMSWDQWLRETGHVGKTLSAIEAMAGIEALVAGHDVKLPWQ